MIVFNEVIPTVSQIVWKLRETLARRRITNKALADEIGIHPTNVSRLKTRDTLPAIGSDDIEKIRLAITKLSSEEFGVCPLSELIELREN
jgi:putative transcriptional regulator